MALRLLAPRLGQIRSYKATVVRKPRKYTSVRAALATRRNALFRRPTRFFSTVQLLYAKESKGMDGLLDVIDSTSSALDSDTFDAPLKDQDVFDDDNYDEATLKNMTVKNLRELATEMGFTGSNRPRKTDLITFILNASAPKAPAEGTIAQENENSLDDLFKFPGSELEGGSGDGFMPTMDKPAFAQDTTPAASSLATDDVLEMTDSDFDALVQSYDAKTGKKRPPGAPRVSPAQNDPLGAGKGLSIGGSKLKSNNKPDLVSFNRRLRKSERQEKEELSEPSFKPKNIVKQTRSRKKPAPPPPPPPAPKPPKAPRRGKTPARQHLVPPNDLEVKEKEEEDEDEDFDIVFKPKNIKRSKQAPKPPSPPRPAAAKSEPPTKEEPEKPTRRRGAKVAVAEEKPAPKGRKKPTKKELKEQAAKEAAEAKEAEAKAKAEAKAAAAKARAEKAKATKEAKAKAKEATKASSESKEASSSKWDEGDVFAYEDEKKRAKPARQTKPRAKKEAPPVEEEPVVVAKKAAPKPAAKSAAPRAAPKLIKGMSLRDFLGEIRLSQYITKLEMYGLEEVADIFDMEREDWEENGVKPFHFKKMVKRAKGL